MEKHISSILCVVPPYILNYIAEHGDEAQKEKARRTLITTDQLRQQRLTTPRQGRELPLAGVAIKQRIVYTANFGSNLPGTQVRSEGQPPTGDAAADEAYDGAGATYDLYMDVYQRSSVDGNGMRLDSTVHYQQGYDNAFWDGSQMVYGDGDEDLPPAQRIFNRFTIAIDVMGHELTHGVTQFTANLNYSNQSGALNESISDVFGSLVKQRNLMQDALTADWIIGQGLLTSNVNGIGLRSMKAPGTAYDDPVLGKDPQPADMSHYVNTSQDNGGVHINSGIPNRAFYLIAVEIGGNAWEKAGKIWYTALKDKLQPTSNFQDAANQTFAVAGDLFGQNSLEQMAVSHGWAGVGITVGGSGGGSTNPGCFGSIMRMLRGEKSSMGK
jgi:Zn-dependent metalloprotease